MKLERDIFFKRGELKVSRLAPIHVGDWHDPPIRWKVSGNGFVQHFCTKRQATSYASCIRKHGVNKGSEIWQTL